MVCVLNSPHLIFKTHSKAKNVPLQQLFGIGFQHQTKTETAELSAQMKNLLRILTKVLVMKYALLESSNLLLREQRLEVDGFHK